MSVQPDPYYWWTDLGGLVIEWFRDSDPDTGDDKWVQLVAFEGGMDREWRAFARPALDYVKDPALTAYQHLRRWESLRVAWGHEHPDEPLPEWILSDRTPPGATR